MTIIKRISYLALHVFICVGCDQATKSAAQQYLLGQEPVAFLSGLLHFKYAENPGAFLSLGATLAPETRAQIFIIAVSLLLTCLLAYIVYNIVNNVVDEPSLLTIALTFYLAGGLGNLIDRFMNDGHVIDFMIMRVGRLQTGIFNVADMLIMLGVGLLLFAQLKQKPLL